MQQVKYRLTRDSNANGIAPNTVPSSPGKLAPANIYLTKQFLKGSIVQGTIATEDRGFAVAGKSLLIKSTGAATTTGIAYPGEVELALSLDNNSLEPIDANGNVISSRPGSIKIQQVFTPVNILLFVLLIGTVIGYFKWIKTT